MTLGELADWASLGGFVLTLANAVALFWIVRRTQFNLSADQIVRRLDQVTKTLGSSLAVTEENQPEVLAVGRRAEAMLRGVRRLVDRPTQRTIDKAIEAAQNLARALEARAHLDAANTEARRLFAALHALREDIISLRDRRRAGP
jgi:HD-GYP domain-containing protein (c-di-GMP phosphodiesterase class II)